MEQNVLGIKVQALYWCILNYISYMYIYFYYGQPILFSSRISQTVPFNVFVCVWFSYSPEYSQATSFQKPRKVVLNLWATTLAGSPKTTRKYIFCGLRNCDTSALSISRHVQPHICQVFWALSPQGSFQPFRVTCPVCLWLPPFTYSVAMRAGHSFCLLPSTELSLQ